jgi:hypothetical protein
MFRSFGARLVTAFMLGALFLGAVAAPAAAATKTRWVDNNTSNAGPAACASAKFSTIQAAINASSAWDQVNVCPGNYREQITINKRGLEVRSVPALGAKIWAPETLTEVDFTTALVHITARDVMFVGFWLKFDDGDLEILPPPVRAEGRPAEVCEMVDAAIWAEAPHATIKANHIKTVGPNTLSGDCGYLFGIVLADALSDETGGEWGPDTSLVWRNWVKDFKFGGILVAGDRSVRVWNNNIRYVHYDDIATCNLVPVLGVNPSVDYPCEGPFVENTSPLDGIFPFGAGIMVEGSLVDLRANTVYSTLDTGLLDVFSELPPFLFTGIALVQATDGSRVRSNIVDNTFIGIVLTDEGFFFPGVQPVPDAPDGVAVSGSRVSETFFGMVVETDDNYFYANRVHLSIEGMWATETSSNNTFDHNDFRYNADLDCDDDSIGGGDYGTANWWSEPNLGFEDDPDGICMPFFPAI